MASLTVLLILSSHVLLQLASLNTALPDCMQQTCYYERGNYTLNSAYQRKLGSLLSSLESNNETDFCFYNLSVGQPPNQVNSIAFCRGDVGLDDCQGCIRNASLKILEVCPNQTDAIGIYNFCRLWYSNSTIFGVLDDSRTFFIRNPNNASNVNQFIQAQQTLFDRLRTTTASGDSTRKFATGNESAGFERLFALMQCSPDLSYQGCDVCLARAISDIGNCCAGKIAARVIKPSCDVRYDNKLFYDPAAPVAPPPSPLGSQAPESSPSPPAAPTEGRRRIAKPIKI